MKVAIDGRAFNKQKIHILEASKEINSGRRLALSTGAGVVVFQRVIRVHVGDAGILSIVIRNEQTVCLNNMPNPIIAWLRSCNINVSFSNDVYIE